MPSQSGVKQDALGISGANAGTATSAIDTTLPVYQQLALHPQGLTPQQMADARTASGQGLGGGISAATGESDLAGARTGEGGAYAAALDDAARSAGVTQSENSVKLQTQSDQIERQQQEEGLQGLTSIYGTSDANSLKALDVANQAQKPFWQQFLQSSLNPAASAYGSYANNN